MTEPSPRRTATSHAIWEGLPEYIQQSDRNGALWGFISVWGEHFHDLVDIVLQINANPSILADPENIPPNWWPWLAAIVDYNPTTVVGAGLQSTPFARQRTRIADPGRLKHCTPAALRETLRDLWPAVTDPNVEINKQWRGNRWIVRFKTDPAEIPATGVMTSTWDEWEESFATWDDLEAMVPTWTAWEAGIDRIHLLITRALEAERPAGVRYCHNRLDGLWDTGFWDGGLWDS